MCALVACAVGPDYHRPAIETPAAYEYLPKDAADTINTEWWKQFGDPVLDQLIAEALANNKSVKQAAANVQQAAAVLTEAKSPFYPQVGYDAGGTRQQFSTDFLPNQSTISRTQSSYSVIASASWEIDLWGRIRRQTGVSTSEPAGDRRGAPRRDPLARGAGRQQLSEPALAR